MTAIVSRLADLVGDRILTSARVSEVTPLTSEFVRVTLTDPSFATSNWAPGTKLQMRPERGTVQLRTYTPINWDSANKTTQVIGQITDHGPGGRWFSEVAVGDRCEVFGPRRSMPLDNLADDAVFIGDETSVGLACSFRDLLPNAKFVFEAVDTKALADVLDVLDLGGATIVDKSSDPSAVLDAARSAADTFAGQFDVAVSGDAKTVHAVRRGTRDWPSTPRKVHGKAYWAEGRSGLD